jgi:NapC/NirT cytochrome c family, N-terminal region/Cytochrome c3
MTRRKVRLFLLLGITLIVLFSGWFFVDVTARRSSFCDNCHYMQPYVAQWKNSTHKNVACIQCHPTQRRAMFAQFIKNVTRTYNPRPRAYVPDEACASSTCHAGMPKSNAVKFLTVTFPHQPHLGVDRRGIRLHCASCHGASNEAGHVSVDKRICYLCHFKGQPVEGTLTWCGSCHGAPTGMSQHAGFIFDMKAYASSGVQCSRCHVAVHEGSGEVSKDKCFSCHVSRIEAISNPKALHANHVGEQQIRCTECHEPIRHGNIKILSVLDVSCESCHPNLHVGPKETYLGVGAREVPATPSRMFAAQIKCTGCHTQVIVRGGVSLLSQGNKTANPKACAACHDARFIPMVERWKAQGKLLMSEARRLSNEGKLLAARSPSNAEAQKAASDLEFNANFLEQGHPVHNIEYGIRIVQTNSGLLEKLAARVKASSAAAAVQPAFARGSFSYCTESCHTFIPRKEPFSFKGVDFPHTFHVQKAGLPCDTCHKENHHKELSLAGTADCVSCHHATVKADCARCHARQAAFIAGKLPPLLGVTAKPDVMSGIVGCVDCHDPTKTDPLKEVSKSCETCHEGKGAQDLATWRKQLQDEGEKLRLLSEENSMALNGLQRRGIGIASYRARFETARGRLEYLEKAKGVHNMAASLSLLNKSRQEFSALLSETTKVSAPAPAKKENTR